MRIVGIVRPRGQAGGDTRRRSLWFRVRCLTVAALAAAVIVPALAGADPSPISQSPSRTTDGAQPVGSADYSPPLTAYYVSPTGNDSALGNLAMPWRTIAHAVATAPSGSTIVVRGGVYNEAVTIPAATTLTIQPYPQEAVWLDGAIPVQGWVLDHAGVWRVDNWTTHFRDVDYDPNAPKFLGPINKNYPMAGHPDMVFYDGTPLTQVAALDQVRPGTFYVDETAAKLYVGNSPAGHLLEASVRGQALVVNSPGTTIRGIGIRRYATPMYRHAAVRVVADNVTLDNDVITDNATGGVLVHGADAALSHLTVDANGQIGIVADQSDQLALHDSLVTNNNAEHFNNAPVAGAFKCTRCRNDDIRHNTFYGNLGNVIWFDQSSYNAEIINNVIQRNAGPDIHYEISGYGVIADNLLSDGVGMLLADANNVQVWNNTLVHVAKGINILDGPRVAATMPNNPGHDPRYPSDPNVTWVVTGLRLRNNIISDSTAGRLLGVDDATRSKTGGQMADSDDNAFYRPQAALPRYLIVWCNYGGSPTKYVAANLASFQAQTGRETHSVAADGGRNPFLPNMASGDYTVPPGSPAYDTGQPLPSDIAAAIGVPATGQPVSMGKLTP